MTTYVVVMGLDLILYSNYKGGKGGMHSETSFRGQGIGVKIQNPIAELFAPTICAI